MIQRLRLFAVLILTACLSFGAKAATTTNFSDQWWNPNESGWGASVLQQRDVLFVDLFVYAADGRPTWFTAAAYYTTTGPAGHVVFVGDLYVTSGPYFALGTFDPAQVASRRVGTLTFDADSSDTATLAYSVDGLIVTKSVTRQLWTYEDFTGSYNGGLVYDLASCANPANNGHVEELGTILISHTGNTSFAMTTQASQTCNWNGAYSQLGHMGTVRGTFSCNTGIQGTFTALELEKNINGMTGRFVAADQFCQLSGHFGGVLR